MNKEDILKKAQAENKDEMELQVKNKSLTFSYIVMVVMTAIFTGLRSEQGTVMDLCAAVCGSVCAGMTYRFFKTKKTIYLVIALITLIVMIIAIIRFAMGH